MGNALVHAHRAVEPVGESSAKEVAGKRDDRLVERQAVEGGQPAPVIQGIEQHIGCFDQAEVSLHRLVRDKANPLRHVWQAHAKPILKLAGGISVTVLRYHERCLGIASQNVSQQAVEVRMKFFDLVRAQIDVLGFAEAQIATRRTLCKARPRLPSQQRGGNDQSFAVVSLGTRRLAGRARQEIIDLGDARRVRKSGPRALDWRKAKEGQEIVGDVGADLPVVQDSEPTFANPFDDLFEAAGNDEGLERVGRHLGQQSLATAGRTDHSGVEGSAIDPLQDPTQIAEKNSLVPVGDHEADPWLAARSHQRSKPGSATAPAKIRA